MKVQLITRQGNGGREGLTGVLHVSIVATFLRGTWYSVFPVLTVDGIIALDIFPSSVDRERFLGFLHEQVVCTFCCAF